MDEYLLNAFHTIEEDIRTSDEKLRFMVNEYAILPLQIELYCYPECVDTEFTLDGPLPDHIFAGEDFYEKLPNDIEFLHDCINNPENHPAFYKEHYLYWEIVCQKLGVLKLRKYFAELRNRQRLEDAWKNIVADIKEYDRDTRIKASEKQMLLKSRCLKY